MRKIPKRVEIMLDGSKNILIHDPGTMNAQRLRAALGTHKTCGEQMHFKRTTETHNVICCHDCMFRLEVPIEIKTYDELDAWCKQRMPPPPTIP